jgi:hypothetical protein
LQKQSSAIPLLPKNMTVQKADRSQETNFMFRGENIPRPARNLRTWVALGKKIFSNFFWG